QKQSDELRRSIGLKEGEPVVIAGSTHEGEELALLESLKQLKNFRLIIAPRHPERWDHVADQIQFAGFQTRRCSQGERFEAENDVYMLDTIGQLFSYYSIATVAFVGGTLARVGGHSLAEPYAYGVPVVCGPHLFKTSDIARSLREAGVIKIVQNEDELTTALQALLESSELRKDMGRDGQKWVQESQGA